MAEKIYNKFIRFFCVILTGYLFLQGLFTLCNIQRVEEKTFFVSNNALVQMIGILLFALFALILLKERIWSLLAQYGHILFGALTFLVFCFLIWWVTQTVFWYYGDAEWMYRCALELLEGNFSQWEPGGYCYMWPFQSGTVLLIAGILRFFSVGQSFYLFPMLCIVFYIITILSLYATLRMMFADKALVNLQGIMLILYVPYAFLTMCMYGDLIGYGWGALAIFHAVKYVNYDRLRNLIYSGICLFLAICFKQNCAILFVGILVLLTMKLLSSREKAKLLRGLLGLAVFLLIVLAGIRLPDVILSQLSGLDMPTGNSKWAHLAMGAQESDKAPGWYNNYNAEVFERNNYDTDKTAAESKAALRESLSYFVEHPDYAWEFYNKKLASEWNNPTMECFHVQNFRNTAKELSSFVKSTINDGGKINILAIWYLDIAQSVLLFGILMYFLHEQAADYKQLLWGLLFMGAFAFWMFWEAKARYVAPYLLFLIPYSFMGYRILIQNWKEKRVYLSVFVLLALVAFLHLSNAGWVTSSFKISQDTESYYEYIHEYNNNFVNLRY
ncbi:MAG: glycosyltransferase family 39 protein [Butyrivibrio sp.]|nr:glycosyltransferase family 39 protein [Muribaculum sp.]MCM1551394.1 glycosyltransferase family 39 protein [Butyrivibrio sp.]